MLFEGLTNRIQAGQALHRILDRVIMNGIAVE